MWDNLAMIITAALSVIAILATVWSIINARQMTTKSITSSEGISLHSRLLQEVTDRRASEQVLQGKYDEMKEKYEEVSDQLVACHDRERANRLSHEQDVYVLRSEIYTLRQRIDSVNEREGVEHG